jgi:hypothetical protein
MLKPLLVAGILFAEMLAASANEPSSILQKAAQNVDIASSLVLSQGWVQYPPYEDRDGWAAFLGEYQDDLSDDGIEFIGYEWQNITEDDYLAYDRYDDRHPMEDKYFANARALRNLFIAELAGGKGRYLKDIAAGVEWYCSTYSWAVVSHLAKYQKSKSPVPDRSEQIIELYSGNVSQMLSWIHYFLGPQLDGLNPGLSFKLKSAIKEKTMDPYLERDDYRWMGFVPVPGKKLNNWNPWCNQNVLLCYMLLEDNPDRLAQAVEKSMRSVDLWLESLPSDGCCDEGTTYWYKSVGHLLDYLENLERITGGAVTLWDNPFLQIIGEFIVNADIGDCWQVNFADGTPSRRPISYWIYRYGKASGNKLMMDFAVNSWHRFGNDPTDVDWVLFYQGLEAIAACREMKAMLSPEVSPKPFVNYPESDVCFIRKGKSFLAAKGGNNSERHNHNDIGSCIYFYDSVPVLIDAGVGTYEKNTFGPRRYENWFVQSGWHNLPVINGCEQVFGGQYRASGSRASRPFRSFRTDISSAYPDSGRVESWTVKYRLTRRGGLKITHRFSLKDAIAPNMLHFLVAEKPELRADGTISLTGGVQMKYDPGVFTAGVEEKPLTGLGFSSRWGDALYRISLTAKTPGKRGRYVVRIDAAEKETILAIAERVTGLAKSQYRLLDARLAPDQTPRGLNPDGSAKDGSVGSWTSGFFPGALWQLYRLTQDPDVLSMAERRTFALDSLLSFPQSHDLGFQVNCSYGNGYKLTAEPRYLPLIEQGAGALASRFNPSVGATLSWAVGEKGASYPVIIDNMMNLELLEYASKLFHCDSLNDIAVKHAETTMENHFRPDYSTYHMLDYDSDTGVVRSKVTVQGFADESAWARGQAWALYGYTMMYRETGREEFLRQAEGIAGMLLSRLPSDGIPYWDFDAPDIPDTYRDASAAAVMCSAFIELSTLTRDRKLAGTCRSMAERQIRTLASPEYLASQGENGGFLLKHGIGNLPGGSEIDTPLIYADYYFLEALNRLQQSKIKVCKKQK